MSGAIGSCFFFMIVGWKLRRSVVYSLALSLAGSLATSIRQLLTRILFFTRIAGSNSPMVKIIRKTLEQINDLRPLVPLNIEILGLIGRSYAIGVVILLIRVASLVVWRLIFLTMVGQRFLVRNIIALRRLLAILLRTWRIIGA
jgi:hypothetical protein